MRRWSRFQLTRGIEALVDDLRHLVAAAGAVEPSRRTFGTAEGALFNGAELGYGGKPQVHRD